MARCDPACVGADRDLPGCEHQECVLTAPSIPVNRAGCHLSGDISLGLFAGSGRGGIVREKTPRTGVKTPISAPREITDGWGQQGTGRRGHTKSCLAVGSFQADVMRLRISRRLVARVALVDENVDSENPASGSVAIYSHDSRKSFTITRMIRYDGPALSISVTGELRDTEIGHA
jgi:hypothetical protein